MWWSETCSILEFLHPDVILGCCDTPCSLGLMQQQQKQTITAVISARLLAGFRVLHRLRVSSFRRLGSRTSSWVVLSCWVVEFSQDLNFHSMENRVGIADFAKGRWRRHHWETNRFGFILWSSENKYLCFHVYAAAYRLATGAAAAPEVAGRDKEPGSFEAAQKVETTKRSTSRHQHDSRSEQSTSTSPSILSLKLFTSCIASMNILSFGSVTSSWCTHQFR